MKYSLMKWIKLLNISTMRKKIILMIQTAIDTKSQLLDGLSTHQIREIIKSMLIGCDDALTADDSSDWEVEQHFNRKYKYL